MNRLLQRFVVDTSAPHSHSSSGEQSRAGASSLPPPPPRSSPGDWASQRVYEHSAAVPPPPQPPRSQGYADRAHHLDEIPLSSAPASAVPGYDTVDLFGDDSKNATATASYFEQPQQTQQQTQEPPQQQQQQQQQQENVYGGYGGYDAYNAAYPEHAQQHEQQYQDGYSGYYGYEQQYYHQYSADEYQQYYGHEQAAYATAEEGAASTATAADGAGESVAAADSFFQSHAAPTADAIEPTTTASDLFSTGDAPASDPFAGPVSTASDFFQPSVQRENAEGFFGAAARDEGEREEPEAAHVEHADASALFAGAAPTPASIFATAEPRDTPSADPFASAPHEAAIEPPVSELSSLHLHESPAPELFASSHDHEHSHSHGHDHEHDPAAPLATAADLFGGHAQPAAVDPFASREHSSAAPSAFAYHEEPAAADPFAASLSTEAVDPFASHPTQQHEAAALPTDAQAQPVAPSCASDAHPFASDRSAPVESPKREQLATPESSPSPAEHSWAAPAAATTPATADDAAAAAQDEQERPTSPVAPTPAARESQRLAEMYKAMAERLEAEKNELLRVLADQTEQFYQMQDYIHSLEREVAEYRARDSGH
ncbi:hypothetical protein ATCC90586_003412 [Pythium insidiosum]|nr:hypothetical protein ATCC90586_003412 [Pythium insidiosum]